MSDIRRAVSNLLTHVDENRKVALYSVCGGVVVFILYKSLSAPKLPPGPRPLPIIGNTYTLSTGPRLYRQFVLWGKEYGPLFTVDLSAFMGKAVVLNDYETVKEALTGENAVNFAGRPMIWSLHLFSGEGKNISFSQMSTAWQTQRKITYSAFKLVATGKDLISKIEVGFESMEKYLSEMAVSGESFNPRNIIAFGIFNTIMKLTAGYVYDTPENKEFILLNKLNREAIEIVGSGLLGDYVPFLRFLPTPGKKWVLKSVADVMDLFRQRFKEHEDNFDANNINDVVDAIIKCKLEAERSGDDNIKLLTEEHYLQIMLDVFGAGTDTSVDTINWSVLLSARHPEFQQRAYDELCSVLKPGESPNFYMRAELPYTEAFFNEVMRFGPVAPLALPHMCIKDTKFRGYDIPKGTQIMPNIFALHRDEKYWNDPYDFNPSRFLTSEGKMRHNVESFLSFSIGRRVCVGEAIARPELFTFISNLLLRWEFYVSDEMEKPSVEGVENPILYVPDNEYKICVRARPSSI